MRLIAFRIQALLVFASLPLVANAQTAVPWQGGGVDNNWTTAPNWDHPFIGALPTGFENETAVISNGDTVLVDSDLGLIPAPDGPPGGLTVSGDSVLQMALSTN